MIELEVYAAGLRNIDKILELDHLLETIPGLRYKVDRSHDLVYLEMEETAITLRELRAMFRKIKDATARFLIAQTGRWRWGENDRAFFHCHRRASRRLRPLSGRACSARRRYLSFCFHSPIALAFVPPANCRDRLVITGGRDGDRRLHWRRFRCPNLFSI